MKRTERTREREARGEQRTGFGNFVHILISRLSLLDEMYRGTLGGCANVEK